MASRTNIKLREQITLTPIGELKPASRNPRTHSRRQLKQIATSIERFGFTNPVLVDAGGQIGLVTVLCRSLISLCHLGFECERADAAQV